MKKTVMLLCTLLALGLIPIQVSGQTSTDSTSNVANPKSVLRLGLATYSRYDYDLGLTLDYERFLSPRLSIKANIFSNLRLGKETRTSYNKFTGDVAFLSNYKSIANFSIAFNYYFKKNSQSGHFLSFQVNDVFSFFDRTQYFVNKLTEVVDIKEKRVFESNPQVGLYYGYRKKFNSGLFIEGRVGMFFDNSFIERAWTREAQLSIGWTIPFRKKNR